LSDAWFQAVECVLKDGRQWTVEYGSYEGQKRWELDYVTIHITHPGVRPLVPEMPYHLSNIPPPTTMEYVEEYLPYLMTDQPLKKNELYTYGQRVAPQMEEIIKRYKEHGFGSNQECIAVAQPEDIYLEDPPCFPSGTDVVTERGNIDIADVRVGDYVLSHAGLFRRVTEIHSRPYKGDLRYLKFMSCGSGLTTTQNHKFLGVRVLKCPCDSSLNCKPNCRKKDSVYRGKCPEVYKSYKPSWISASGLDQQTFLALPRVQKDTEASSYSSEELYLFGMYLAQGWPTRKDGICFAIDDKKPHLKEKIIECVKKAYGKDIRVDPNYAGCSRLTFYSREITQYYTTLFGKGARTKHLPSEFLMLSRAEITVLLGGWVDGDGWRKKDGKKSSLCTTSPSLARSAQLLLIKLGVLPSLIECTIKDSTINGRTIRANGTAFVVEWVDKPASRHYWSDSSYMYAPVRSNLVIPFDGLVYNLDVDKDESYVAGGASVHNCLRQIDTRIMAKDGLKKDEDPALHFFLYFRSWDLWGGFPANLGAIRLMQEYMADSIGVEAGEIIASSKGLHLYDHSWDIAQMRVR
jgi:hypothetical protein